MLEIFLNIFIEIFNPFNCHINVPRSKINYENFYVLLHPIYVLK